MATKRTQVWAAQDALLAALQGCGWDEPIKPMLGTPARFDGDQVWVSGEVDQWTAQYRTSGLGTKDEVFTLRVHCLATRLGGGYTELRDRLATMGALVEDVLQDDFTLGGTVMLATIGSQQIEETMLDDGRRRQGLLTFFIECTAHVAG